MIILLLKIESCVVKFLVRCRLKVYKVSLYPAILVQKIQGRLNTKWDTGSVEWGKKFCILERKYTKTKINDMFRRTEEYSSHLRL